MKRCFIWFNMALLPFIFSCRKERQVTKDIPCIPAGLDNHVIAFYSFANGSLNDLSGGNHHLTNSTNAQPTTDRNGTVDCAYEFTNTPVSNQFLHLTNTSFLNALNEFSVSVWYQALDSSSVPVKYESLVQRGTGFSCPDRIGQWSVGLYDCRKAVFGRTNSVWDQQLSASSCDDEYKLRTGVWVHLAATFKLQNLEMKIYRNGVLQNTSIGTANCSSGVPLYQDIGDLFVGQHFTGKLDDLVLFNKALTAQEVNGMMNIGTCCEP
ncbi:MAG: LamG domain-containing protein [Chitinophagaceae bacterium]|nr:LamG domain-containing protein [Chitinophagaceae bacterium]